MEGEETGASPVELETGILCLHPRRLKRGSGIRLHWLMTRGPKSTVGRHLEVQSRDYQSMGHVVAHTLRG